MSRRRSMRLRSNSDAEETMDEDAQDVDAVANEKEVPKKRKRRNVALPSESESESGGRRRGRGRGNGYGRGKRRRKSQEEEEESTQKEEECHSASYLVSPSSRALLVSSTAASSGADPEESPLVVDQEALYALEEVTDRELGENELFNIVASPPSPRRERRAPRKAIFASDLADMMYGKGDERHPSKESIALLDAIVQEYIESMMKSTATEVTSRKATSNMNETDLLFRVRHDKAKFERAVYLLKVSREVKQIKNAWKLQTSVSDDEDESLFN